jgi:phage shock protein C
MHKVTLVSLNGNASQFSLDEEACKLLEQYLHRAERRLWDNPDRADVLNDLEQSIGDKFAALGYAQQRVLTATDVRSVLDEIGVVDAGNDQAASQGRPFWSSRRRLHRIRDNQKIAGICSGLAAYADLDVTLVRVIFILLAFFTGGVFIAVYIVAMFIIPLAKTPEDYAAAGYTPLAR